jgi:hypothetical protein
MNEVKLLNRTDAAEFLEISTRTLDRYVQNGKLSPLRKKGQLYFREEDLVQIKGGGGHTPHIMTSSPAGSAEARTTVPAVGNFPAETEKYKVLWEAARAEVHEKNELLMGLHQRLGFLESELKNSVPLLTSQTHVQDMEKTISNLRRKVHEAKVGKMLFIALFLLSLLGSFALILSRILEFPNS